MSITAPVRMDRSEGGNCGDMPQMEPEAEGSRIEQRGKCERDRRGE